MGLLDPRDSFFNTPLYVHNFLEGLQLLRIGPFWLRQNLKELHWGFQNKPFILVSCIRKTLFLVVILPTLTSIAYLREITCRPKAYNLLIHVDHPFTKGINLHIFTFGSLAIKHMIL